MAPLIFPLFFQRFVLIFGMLTLMTVSVADAQKVRVFKRIAAPEAPPAGTELIEEMLPPDPGLAQNAIAGALEGWNSGKFGENISTDFQDKSRLLDNFANDVPLDAELRVVSMRNYRPMQQFGMVGDNGNVQLTTRIQVTVDTEIQFNDAQRGFRRLEGTNDFIVDVTEELIPIPAEGQ